MTDQKPFQFEISLSVLNHLGRNLYRNFITVLGEAISNAWDADAKNVWITIDKANSSFVIKDDGIGMDSDDFQNKFLRIGYSKRSDGSVKSAADRPFIGAKGIGKLALLSCADTISIYSKKRDGDYIGGVIENSGLDQAIKSDLTPDKYPLEAAELEKISSLTEDHDHGTIILFENLNERLRNSEAHLRKLLAMGFRFTLLDEDFSIFLNGTEVTVKDVQDLLGSTEFLWIINGHDDAFVGGMKNLKANPVHLTTTLPITGFFATVHKPRDLKISGTDARATVDLLVNGRIREKNIIRHIPSQRIVESYLYGQIHFDEMDQLGVDPNKKDPFTSSREGIVEDNAEFTSLLDYLKRDALNKIIDQWDDLRLNRGEQGDEENTKRKSKKERRAQDLVSAAKEEFSNNEKLGDDVEKWISDIRPDAEFNVSAYVDCFLSENLLRKYLNNKKTQLPEGVKKEVVEWRDREEKRKAEANVSFNIRQNDDDLSYLGMDALAIAVEGSKLNDGNQSIWKDAIAYRPVRNAVGHTALITDVAKGHLKINQENMKGRLRTLLKKKK